jgi:predicted RND superfamily exporter protein
VDYGIYIYSSLQNNLDTGSDLKESYFRALRSTGTAVAFTGVTLAIGVGTWIFSPIKFQADMGLMLTFMFFWNMVGALLLLPAIAWLLRVKPRVQATADVAAESA